MMRYSIIPFVALLVFTVGRSLASDTDTLATFLAVQNRNSYGKIATARYSMERRLTWHNTTEIRTAEVAQSGDKRWYHSTIPIKLGHQTTPTPTTAICVLNDEYMAFWSHLSSTAYVQYDPTAISRTANIAQHDSLYRPPDILREGAFGYSGHTLKELMDEHTWGATWHAKEQRSPSGSTVFELFCNKPNVEGHPFLCATIDPTRGYLITAKTAWRDDGKVQAKEQYEVAKIRSGDDDIYFPSKVIRTTSPNTPHEHVDSIILTHVEINHPIADAQFTIAALDIPESVPVAVPKPGTRKTEEYRVVDGKLIPGTTWVRLTRSVAPGRISSADSASGTLLSHTSSTDSFWRFMEWSAAALCTAAVCLLLRGRWKSHRT